MKREGDAKSRFSRVFKDVMRSRGVVNEKACPLESTKNFLRLQSRQAGGHTDSITTVISSFTGSRGSFLSCGIGSPSFCKLSR